jgi:hypothetical protein
MASEIKVRIATPQDVHEVMDMAIASIAETGMAEADPEMILGQVWPALNRWCGIVGIIGKTGESAEGCVLMGLSGLWYSRTQFIEEKFSYVRPDFRSERGAEGGRATKLMEFSKAVSDGIEMPLVMGGSDAITGKSIKGKRRLYSRMFGRQVGAYFLYDAASRKGAMSAETVIVEG